MKFYAVVAAVVVAFVALAVFYPGKGGQHTTQATPLEQLKSMVGKPAPNFTLLDQKGRTFSLAKLRGRKVVLFFNEGIMCYPACWNQMAELGTDKRLNNDKAVSASVVAESPDEWKAAFRKMPELGRGTILFDTDASASARYGMLSLPSSMHKGSKPGHTYVVIDQNGIVRYTLDDPAMAIQNQTIQQELAKI